MVMCFIRNCQIGSVNYNKSVSVSLLAQWENIAPVSAIESA